MIEKIDLQIFEALEIEDGKNYLIKLIGIPSEEHMDYLEKGLLQKFPNSKIGLIFSEKWPEK